MLKNKILIEKVMDLNHVLQIRTVLIEIDEEDCFYLIDAILYGEKDGITSVICHELTYCLYDMHTDAYVYEESQSIEYLCKNYEDIKYEIFSHTTAVGGKNFILRHWL